MPGPGVRVTPKWFAKGIRDHAPNLLALLGGHEDRVKALGYDYRVRERIDRCWRVGDDPLLVFRWQAVAKPHAEVVQELGRIHGQKASPSNVLTCRCPCAR
jgi:hypothetical protein